MSLHLLAAGNDAMLMLLLTAGPLLAAYGVWQLVADLRVASRKKVQSRLKGAPGKEDAVTRAALDSLRRKAPEAGGTMQQAIGRMRMTERLQAILDQANVKLSAAQLLTNMTAGACVLWAVLLVLHVGFLTSLAIACGAFIMPILYLVRRRRKRINKLVSQLPDVFELLSQALRAGHSLASGMQLIANELPDPAGTEFARVFHEQNLGLKIEDALKNLAERMDVLDVRFFVTAVLIQRQTGGDLAEVLDKISGVIRDRIKLHGTVMALTAEGRLSGYVLLALPVVVFVAMLKLNPEYADVLISNPTGQMMSMFSVVMMLMGWVMIKKIVNIKI